MTGKIIDALAEINKKLSAACAESDRAGTAKALLGWWQTPHPDLPKGKDGLEQPPLHLLNQVPEAQFKVIASDSDALSTFVTPIQA